MGFLNITKNLKKTVGQVGDIVKVTGMDLADQVGNTVKNVDLKATANQVGNTVKNIDLKSAADQVGDTVKNIDLKATANQVGDMVKNIGSGDKNEKESAHKGEIASINALQVLYYLMTVDGQITDEEKETFCQLVGELDPQFRYQPESAIPSSESARKQAPECSLSYEEIQYQVERVLNSSMPTADSFITPKLLVWDMMSIAYSDGSYDDNEEKLISFVAERLNVDHAVYLELDSSIRTLNDLEEEIKWIKTTDRPYLTIEAMVNEISDRKNVIFEAVKDLITL